MLTRTITSTVTFARPFHVSGIDGMHPAGTYVVETDEELVEPLSFVAYRRVSTTIQLPPESGRTGCVETYVIDPAALTAALARDAPST
jgi:hypothetical protein